MSLHNKSSDPANERTDLPPLTSRAMGRLPMHVTKLLFEGAGWFFVMSSIIFLLISLFAYSRARTFTRSAARTQGTVIRLERRDSSRSGILYRPVVSFRDSQGMPRELFSSVASSPPSYKVGDQVSVLYSPAEPRKAKLDGFFEVWGWAAITGGIGVSDLLFGLALLWAPMIRRRFGRAPSPPVLNGDNS
jgi:hypothetical protein